MQLSPPTCVDSLTPGDGGAGDMGPPGDSPSGVDAPPPGACIADADCSNGICHELTGACIPDAEVLFVSPSGSGSACSRMAPCGALQTAIDERTQNRFTIALAAGTYSTSFDTSMMPGGVNQMIVSGPTRAWDGAVITSSAMNRVHQQLTAVFEGLTIRGGSSTSGDGINSRGTTTLSRVHIDLAGDDGVVCADGTTKISDSLVTKSANTGIFASSGKLVVERTQVVSNEAYGIHVDNAAYSITNTIIASNGKALMQTGGVRLRGAGSAGDTAVFRFNTTARNQGLSFAAIQCDDPTAISNTIVGEQSVVSPLVSPACTATYSLFNAGFGGPPPGTGNITGDPMFVSTTDFHLQSGSPAIDKADPNAPEPIDIDGQQRSSPPDIGADERQ